MERQIGKSYSTYMNTCNILSVDKCQLLLHEELLQYLVILDEDTEVCYSLSYRNGDVPSVWTEVFNGRVRTSRDLSGGCLHYFTLRLQ